MTELREGLARSLFERAGYCHDDEARLFQPVSWEEVAAEEYAVDAEEWRTLADAAIAYLWPLAMAHAAGVAEEYRKSGFGLTWDDAKKSIAAAIRAQEPPK